MSVILKCTRLNEIRKAFYKSQREGTPPPKLPEIRAKLDEQTEEVFLDKLAEIFAEQYKKDKEREGQTP